MNHLRSHPIGRADNISELQRRRRRRGGGGGGLVYGSGDTEISKLHLPIGVNEDVTDFNVSMEMLAVEVGERVERVSENHGDVGLH